MLTTTTRAEAQRPHNLLAPNVAARAGTVELGMPQLSGVGLSETWLLEKCGDLHWSMICAFFGRPSHRMRDQAGHRVYSSFVTLRISSHGLDRFGEGDRLHLSNALSQRSRTPFESLYQWRSGARTVDVEMLSIFLRRRAAESGNALEEAEIPAPFDCPAAAFGESASDCYALESREIYYFSNLDPGETVTVGFTDQSNTSLVRRHHAEIRRRCDNRLMARVVTMKSRCRPGQSL